MQQKPPKPSAVPGYLNITFGLSCAYLAAMNGDRVFMVVGVLTTLLGGLIVTAVHTLEDDDDGKGR